MADRADGAPDDLPARLVGVGSAAFAVLVAGVTLLRSGVSVGNAAASGLEFARSFPVPPTDSWGRIDPSSWGVVGPAVAHLLGVESARSWALLQILSLGAAGALTLRLLHLRLPTRRAFRAAVVWVSLTAVPATQLHHLRSYDISLLAGGSLAALGAGVPSALVGGLLLGCSNAEAGLLGLAALAVVGRVTTRRDPGDNVGGGALRPERLAVAFAGLVAARVGIAVWFAAVDAEVATRADVFWDNVGISLRTNAALGVIGPFSWFGVAWVAVWLLVMRRRTDRAAMAALIAALVVVPALATVLTLDGTRVFVGLAWCPFLALLVHDVRAETDRPGEGDRLVRWAPVALMASLLVPAIVTTPWGSVFVPWEYLVR